jgi:hypothetical protein
MNALRQIIASVILINSRLSSSSDVFPAVLCVFDIEACILAEHQLHWPGLKCGVWCVARAAAASVPVHGSLESIAWTFKILMMFPIV